MATHAVLLTALLAAASLAQIFRLKSARPPHPETRGVSAKGDEFAGPELATPATVEVPVINLVGNMCERPFWTDVLKLSDAQRKALKTLNDIVVEAPNLSWLADANASGGDRRTTDKRREDAIAQAQRMVASGILNERQAAFVTHRYLRTVGFNALYDDNNLESLGLDSAQTRILGAVLDEYVGAGTSARPHQGQMLTFVDAIRSTLTARQLKTWAELTSELPPPEAPSPAARPAAADVKSSVAEARRASPTLRALAEHASSLGLSANQKELLKEFEQLVGLCLTWIALEEVQPTSLAATTQIGVDRTGRARSEFVAHAERFATLGILTEAQAKRLKTLTEANASGVPVKSAASDTGNRLSRP